MRFTAVMLALALQQGGSPRDRVTLRVEETGDGEAWVTPYVPPTMNFRIESGYIEKGTIVCYVEEGSKRYSDHEDSVFALACDGGARLVLRAIDLR